MDLGEALLRRRGADPQKTNTTNGHAKKPGEAARQDSLTEQVMELLVSQKVYLARGDAFGSESPGWFRIVFAQQRQVLCEGLCRGFAQRMAK